MLKLLQIVSENNRIKILFIVLSLIASGLLETLSISLIFPIIALIMEPQKVHENKFSSQVYDYFKMESPQSFVLLLLGCFVFLFICKNIIIFYFNYLRESYITNRRIEIQTFIYSSYLKAPYTFHLQNSSSTLLKNIDEIGATFSRFIIPLTTIFAEVLVLSFIGLLLFNANAKVTTGIILLFVPVVLIIIYSLRPLLYRLGTERLASGISMSNAFFNGIRAIRDVLILKRQKSFSNIYSTYLESVLVSEMKGSILQQIPRLLIEVILIIVFAVALFTLFINPENIKKYLPLLSLYGLSGLRLLPGLSKIVQNINTLNYSFDSISLFAREYENVKAMNPQSLIGDSLEQGWSQISIKGISYRYPMANKDIFKDLSLNISRGEYIGIVGPSGSGKSTLADIISGLLSPQVGTFEIDGTSYNPNSSKLSEKIKIGQVHQSVFIFDANIAKNIAFGLENADINDKKIQKTLLDAQLTQVIAKLPQGPNTPLGENGCNLSGGERQRVGIARMLYENPELIILDEATASLDGATEDEIINVINGLKGKKTILVIAHRLSTIEECERIVFIKDGEICSEGSFQKLLNDNQEFKQFVNRLKDNEIDNEGKV